MRIGVDVRILAAPHAGIGRACFELTKRFAQAGHELVLFSPNSWFGIAGSADWVAKSTQPTSRLKRLAWASLVLPYMMRRHETDLFWGPAHRLPSNAGYTTPMVVTVHDLAWLREPETMRWPGAAYQRAMITKTLARANRIIASSASTAADLANFDPHSQSRVRIVPLASSFTDMATSNHPPLVHESYILFVGTIEPRKNLARLIEAYALLDQSIRDQFRLIICGTEGWQDHPKIRKLINRNHLDQRISLTGYLPDDQLASLYQHASCLAMPSLDEGFGLPIVEAHTFGVPVLTSNRASMPETAGKAAMFVDPNNPYEIAQGLQKILRDRPFRDNLVKQAALNNARFSWEMAAWKMLNIFAEIVKKPTVQENRIDS